MEERCLAAEKQSMIVRIEKTLGRGEFVFLDSHSHSYELSLIDGSGDANSESQRSVPRITFATRASVTSEWRVLRRKYQFCHLMSAQVSKHQKQGNKLGNSPPIGPKEAGSTLLKPCWSLGVGGKSACDPHSASSRRRIPTPSSQGVGYPGAQGISKQGSRLGNGESSSPRRLQLPIIKLHFF